MVTTIDTATAVGVFDSEAAAQRAIVELRGLGFPEDDIGMEEWADAPTSPGPRAGLGTAGALILGAGALAGYGAAWAILFYPAVGTAITGAALALVVAAAGLVVAVAEFARGSLASRRAAAATSAHPTDVPGQTVVSVRAGARYPDALAVLRRHGAMELDTTPAVPRVAA